jgi:hypothetical protein
MRRDMPHFEAPPILSGASYTVPQPVGGRRKAVLTAAVTEIKLTGDIFLAPPDSGGNVATTDMVGDVVVEFEADGDDVAIVFGPSGGGAAGPTYLGATAVPAFTAGGAGGTIYNAKGASVPPKKWTLSAGAKDHRHDSMYVISRAANCVINYRVISTLPGMQ